MIRHGRVETGSRGQSTFSRAAWPAGRQLRLVKAIWVGKLAAESWAAAIFQFIVTPAECMVG